MSYSAYYCRLGFAHTAIIRDTFEESCIDVKLEPEGRYRDSGLECRPTVDDKTANDLCLPKFQLNVSHINRNTLAFRVVTKFQRLKSRDGCRIYHGNPGFLGHEMSGLDQRGGQQLAACLRIKVLYSNRNVVANDFRLGRSEIHYLSLANIESSPFLTKTRDGKDFIGDSHSISIEHLHQARDVRLELAVGRGVCGSWPVEAASGTVQRNLICHTALHSNESGRGAIFLHQLGKMCS